MIGRPEPISRLLVGCVSLMLIGCTSTGNLGLMAKPTASPGELLSLEEPYRELGPVEGRACRYFLLSLFPLGDSSITTAMERALDGEQNDDAIADEDPREVGDAMLNVSVTTSLYGFFPIYNVLSFTCTTVKGVAVKFAD